MQNSAAAPFMSQTEKEAPGSIRAKERRGMRNSFLYDKWRISLKPKAYRHLPTYEKIGEK